MTPEEEQKIFEEEYNKVFPYGLTFEECYKKLQEYNGKYKLDFASVIADQLISAYIGGYYRYEVKQTEITDNLLKNLYVKICDEYFPKQIRFDGAVYSFIKGDNKKVIPFIEEYFTDIKDSGDFDEASFCGTFLDHFKEGYKGFWEELTLLAHKYGHKKVEELSNLMDSFYKCDNNKTAIDLLLTFSQTNPDYSLPYELLGYLYTDEKMWYNAIQCFEKIRDKSKLFYFYNIEFSLGWVYGKVKEYSQEEIAYRKCLELAPWYDYALNNLGYCLYQQKKYSEAIEIFKQCIVEKRDLSYAPHNLVRSYIRAGLYEDARKFIAENEFKISKNIIEQLEKKPKKNQKITPAVSDEDDIVDVPDEQAEAEIEVKTKFFEKKSQFSSEKVLEDELTSRLESGQPVFGLNLHIYRKKGDYYGRQYPCADGKWRLDLLCEDKDENLYILELKKDSGYDDAYEQTKQYVDWFEKNKVKKGKKVYGIIVLNSPKKKLVEKVRADDRIRLFEYQIAYKEIT
ncbi:MAG: DUF91 domain-containing protein [Anaerovibrio sp.]|uniref:endonuclease NucS domain-containing protein n=1 Tax=Anaerovibrio sp. TaxID=1872532 RepID=UPI0025C43D5A|nr:endonuclease NucS domain-containing protein [Anaerovibrio sp.]MBE6099932.1 DUF91 domain-containing protein [Anaerovibrio sp.]